VQSPERRPDSIVQLVLGASHVFVFASFPFLSVYAANLATFPMAAHMLLRPIAAACVATVAALVVLRLQTDDLQHRAVELSLFLIGFLSFILTSTLGNGYWLRTGKPDWLLAGAHLILGLLLASCARTAGRAMRIAPVLRVTAAALLFATLGQSAVASARRTQWHPAVEAIGAAAYFSIPAHGPRPDIVHLLLDGFGSPRVLQTYYGLDISRDIAALEARHFTVAQGARSNYAYTYSSVPSFLNASYLDPLGPFAGTADRRPLRYLIDNASVITTLKRAGYRFTFIGSSYSATDRHPLADRCDCAQIGLNELETAVYRFSPFRVFRMDWLTYEPFRRKILYELEAVRRLEADGPPRYVLAHLILPHPPFAFDAQGKLPAGARPLFGMPDGDEFPGSREQYEEGYRAQVRFALDQVSGIVAELQRSRPTVIIVSGDHGPGSRLRREDKGQSDLRERFNVFLAVHVPGRVVTLPPDMTLVNLYREVLSQSLDASVTSLPNRTIFTSFSSPYRFEEVLVPAW
jgi:hypothetical protein